MRTWLARPRSSVQLFFGDTGYDYNKSLTTVSGQPWYLPDEEVNDDWLPAKLFRAGSGGADVGGPKVNAFEHFSCHTKTFFVVLEGGASSNVILCWQRKVNRNFIHIHYSCGARTVCLTKFSVMAFILTIFILTALGLVMIKPSYISIFFTAGVLKTKCAPLAIGAIKPKLGKSIKFCN